MKLRKTQLAAAVGAALLVGGTAVQAQNLQVQLYGQVNRALMWADDGTQNKIFNVDGEPSGTRFGIMGTSQVAPGLRAGARIETEMQSNSSDTVTFAAPSAGNLSDGSVGFLERWLDVWVEGSWGRINLGQGSGAADDASTIDLSGTGLANGVCVCDWGSALGFRTAAGAFISGATVGKVLGNQDFESRYDRVMYTTPVFGGFRVQVGTGQKGTAEVNEASIWFSGKVAGDLSAAIGWSDEHSGAVGVGQNNETIGGSLSWLHTSGFNITLGYTQSDITTLPAREGTWWYGKVGYKFGQHAIALDYGQGEDQSAAGDEGTSIGIGYVWNPIRWAEFYAGYHLFTMDHTRTGVAQAEDISVVGIGTRIRF